MRSKEPILNIGSITEHSLANGPGNRFVIWLQGCHLACPNCFNKEFWSFEKRHLLSVDELITRISRVSDIDGVTYTGGEPMLQAKGLAILSEELRRIGLTVVSYSGFTLEELRDHRSKWISRLLNNLDILIDGRYVHEQASSILWRGSLNQKVHFLSPVYKHLAENIDREPADVEFSVDQNGFSTSGIWPEGFLEKLKAVLENGETT